MRDHILNEIRRIAAANGGRAPGRRVFENETSIRPAEWLGIFWARWGDALVEAGFAPNEKQDRLPTEFILVSIVEACRHYGRIPTTAEMRLYGRDRVSFPSHGTIHNGMGGRSGLVERLRDWTRGKSDLADVAAMLPEQTTPRATSHRKERDGSVYLIASGAYFKIGRSDELERRVKEIRIALPETATLMHSIVTDDPAGIEVYWHRRFADRRANGEWFKLTPADVAAFKRRKFQ